MASLIVVNFGCATRKEYQGSRGAGKAKAEVAIFKAHLEKIRRIVSASDGRIEYQYDSSQKGNPWMPAHPRVKLLPGQYIITAKTWPFDTVYEFEVDLEAGHSYKAEESLCNFECRSKGKPYRHDRWIEDLTTRERVSGVVSECYMANTRKKERWKVPCPNGEDDRGSRVALKADADAATGEEEDLDARDAGKAIPEAAADKEGCRDDQGENIEDAEAAAAPDSDPASIDAASAAPAAAIDQEDDLSPPDAGKSKAAAAAEDDEDRDAPGAGKADTETAAVHTGFPDSQDAALAAPTAAIDRDDDFNAPDAGRKRATAAAEAEEDHEVLDAGKAEPAAASASEDDPESRGAGKAKAEVAIFKADVDNIRRIVSASDGHIEYQYNSEQRRGQGADKDPSIQLMPGAYTITVKTWPFGSLYEFEVDLKPGHIYEVGTDLCSFKCILAGEPYRHDRWIQDLTSGERITGVVSECYLGEKRQRERQKVPCPDI